MRSFFLIVFILCSFIHIVRGQRYPAEIQSYSTNISIQGNKKITTIRKEIKVNNRSGDEYTTIQVPFSKMVKVSGLKAFVLDKNGRKVKALKKSDIVTKSSISDISFYEDDFVKEFTLKHNVYPFTVVYTYEAVESEYLYVANWFPVIANDVPTRKATLTINADLDSHLRFKSYKTNSFKVDTLENSILLEWSAQFDGLDNEIYSPSFAQKYPNVLVIDNSFIYETPGEYTSWTSFGKWQYGLISADEGLQDEELKKVRQIVAGYDRDIDKIKALYNYVQDATRYINVSIETGGLKPYPPSYVAERKYGDCKALTNYMRVLLKYVNIDAYYSKIFAGETIKPVYKDFVSQQSNHAILCVPNNGDTLWLDCTSDLAFGYVGTFIQGRNAMVVQPDTSFFASTPAMKTEDALEARKAVFKINDANELLGDFVYNLNGDGYETVFSIEHNYSDNEKNRIVKNYFAPDGFEIQDFKIHLKDRDSTNIGFSFNGKSLRMIESYGNDIKIDILPIEIPNFEDPNKRALPVQIDVPIYEVDTLIYEIGASKEVLFPIEEKNFSSDFGHYKFKIEHKDNLVIVYKEFVLNRGYCTIKEYDSLFDFCNKISDFDRRLKFLISKNE